jgi:hypothetical protein
MPSETMPSDSGRETFSPVDDHLFSARNGRRVAIYMAGLYSFYWTFTYIFYRGLIGTGLFAILVQLAWPHSLRASILLPRR